MTRADFFKRIAAACGLGALLARTRPSVAWKRVMAVTDSANGKAKPGETFHWTGACVKCDSWQCWHNWVVHRGNARLIPYWTYPGEDPNRLDDVIIPTGKECMMPEDLPMLNSLTIESGGTLWQSMDAPYETSPSWLRRLIVEDGAWVGRRRT